MWKYCVIQESEKSFGKRDHIIKSLLLFSFQKIFKFHARMSILKEKYSTIGYFLQGMTPIAKIAFAISISIFIKFEIAIAISIAI